MLFLSLGENCLLGKMFERFGITNTWTTPFTWARSNILYLNKIEEENYINLMKKNLLTYDFIVENGERRTIWRNLSYKDENDPDIFSKICSNGFEFTHHDIVNNCDHRDSYQRKIKRMLSLRKSKEDVLFFYNYRKNEIENLQFVIESCLKFLKKYTSDNRVNKIVCINQNIVKSIDSRGIEIDESHGDCIVVTFHTTKIWDGADGTVDEDLFLQMFFELSKRYVIGDFSFIDHYIVSIEYFIKNKIKSIAEVFFEKSKGKDLYLWGAGRYGKMYAEYLCFYGIKPKGIIDKDEKKQGGFICDIPVISYEEVPKKSLVFIALKNINEFDIIANQIKDEQEVFTIRDSEIKDELIKYTVDIKKKMFS